MSIIRPISDLRNNFAEISKLAHETAQPIFLFFIVYGDIVVLSIEAYENLQFKSEVYFKLKAAEEETTGKRYSAKDIMKAVKEVIGDENV